jgi:hypothetical protein
MPHRLRLTLLAALGAALLPLACEGEHAAEATADAHADGHVLEPAAFEFLDPQHSAHPNWVDMGDIPIGEIHEATVRMKNVEGRPIAIQGVQAGCSCTLPELVAVLPDGTRIAGDMRSRTTILTAPPDSVVELKLRVDSAQAPVKNKDKIVIVRMTTDSPTTPYLTIEARMRIHAPLQAIPPDIQLERVGEHAGGQGFTDITPMAPSGEAVVGVLEAPPGVIATIEPHEISGIALWRLHARLEAPIPLGYQERWITLRTTGPGGEGEGRPLKVKLRWTGAPDVEIAPARMLFLRAGESGELRASAELISHMPGHRVRVVSHSLEGVSEEQIRVSITPLGADEEGRAPRWQIALDPLGPLPETLDGVLKLELDDPQYPRVEVAFFKRS